MADLLNGQLFIILGFYGTLLSFFLPSVAFLIMLEECLASSKDLVVLLYKGRGEQWVHKLY